MVDRAQSTNQQTKFHCQEFTPDVVCYIFHLKFKTSRARGEDETGSIMDGRASYWPLAKAGIADNLPVSSPPKTRGFRAGTKLSAHECRRAVLLNSKKILICVFLRMSAMSLHCVCKLMERK